MMMGWDMGSGSSVVADAVAAYFAWYVSCIQGYPMGNIDMIILKKKAPFLILFLLGVFAYKRCLTYGALSMTDNLDSPRLQSCI